MRTGWTSGIPRRSCASSTSAVWSPPNIPVNTSANACPQAAATFWMSCSTPTSKTTIKICTTARSWAASSRTAGLTNSSSACANSSSGWLWTSYISSVTCSTAAPARISSWTCSCATTMSISSGATTMWSGWVRLRAAPSASAPCSRPRWPTTTTGCSKTAMASTCGICNGWLSSSMATTTCPSGCPTPMRPAAPIRLVCSTAAPSCTRPSLFSCSRWSAASSTATPILR